MAQTSLNAANVALRLMGQREVLTALSDTSAAGLACNDMIDDCKKALLRMHPWNFAIKRKVILPYQNIAVSNVTLISSELLEVTHSSLTLAVGNYVTLTGISGATEFNGTWEVASLPTPGTVTRVTAPGVSSLSTYIASTTDYIRRSPAFIFGYLYDKPSDCLRVLDIDEDINAEDWRVEETFILSDESRLNIRYIKDVTDYSTMDVLFYQVLAHYLAYNLCDHLSASDQKKNELYAYLYGGQGKRGMLPQSRFVDATEDSQQIFEATDWVTSRLTNQTNAGI